MGMMPTPPSPPLPTTRQRPSYQFPRPSASRRRDPISDSDDPLHPEDFSDVFGGPPRTVLSRQFSSGFPLSSTSSTSYFYEEVFRPPAKAAQPPARRSGRSLPEFRIPGQQRRERNGFYSDIFGCDDERVVRSRSRSKASSSSVLSSEELSPLRPAFSVEGDDDVSSFASKLRPINVRTRWNSTRNGSKDYYQRQQNIIPPFSNNQSFHNAESSAYGPDNLRSYPFGLSRKTASPETISLEPISNSSFRVSADDMEPNSPSSPVSSLCHSLGQEGKGGLLDEDEVLMPDNDLEEEEDEAMSSYVIEINSENREGTCESNGVDEAIAWAKEKFQTTQDVMSGQQVSEGYTDSFGSLDHQQVKWEIVEDDELLECRVQTEMDILDEKIRLWSTGKEADIRLLLSSLHHILWSNSGWLPAPLSNIIETSHVKKAYQRARLCLHPDKLQQRGATLQQKYIAEKAFTILQDAWAAFVSLDVF